MSSTRTPGIRIDNRTNCLIIDKEHRGIPIYVRLGVTDQDSAERRLSEEVRCVNEMLALRSSRRAIFADCAVPQYSRQRAPSGRGELVIAKIIGPVRSK